ncbi:MAG: DUF2341 domain-containing protein, partial [Candidatus Thorarchaeota archaeon]
FLFLRFAGIERTFTVLAASDPTGTWLQATAAITSSDLQSVEIPNALLFEIGMGTNSTGYNPQRHFRAFIDDIDLTMNVRPFPEQINLKVNGTSVVGSVSNSIYQYEPDNDTRDAWDLTGTGLDLTGFTFGSSAELSTRVYSGGGTDWALAVPSQSGIQFPVNIPQGAIITSAYLEVEPIGTVANPSMRIYAAGFSSSSTSVEPFTTGLPQLEDRLTWVDTSIDWNPGTWWDPGNIVRIRHRSPEIAPLIQSIVSENNWTAGNYMCLMLDYMYSSVTPASNSYKGAYGSVYSEDELPRLFVEYMIPLPEDTVYFMQYEKDITIDSSQVTATLTDFPVMIDIIDTDLHTDVQADGDDIIFKIGEESLEFEIEYFNQDYSGSEARLVAWVKVPTLSSTQDTVITMAYGNPNARSSSSTAVWDDFETVHHLADDPSGIVYDSTANNYDGTSFGANTSGDLVTGMAGEAINFDFDSGTPTNSDMINIGQIYTDDWSSFTVSLWVNMDIADDCRVFSKSPSTSPTAHIMTTRIASQRLSTRLQTDGGGGVSYSASTPFALGSWQYLVWSWDASRSTIEGYLNGTLDLDQPHGGTTVVDSNDVFVIANNNMESTVPEERFFDGIIDEVRLSRSIRSVAWIQTEFNNQLDPSSFLSVGTERPIQSTWTDVESTTVRFSTSSTAPVDIFPYVTMDIVGGGQTLDENMQDGTSFYVAHDSVVEWTANVVVSPPLDAESIDVV